MTAVTAILIVGIGSAFISFFFLYVLLKTSSKHLLIKARYFLKEKASDPFVLQSIEDQFVDFIQNRLGSRMPVFNMFIDEKLVQELSEVFMEEVSTQLPVMGAGFVSEGKLTQKKISKLLLTSFWPALIVLPSIQILFTVLFVMLM